MSPNTRPPCVRSIHCTEGAWGNPQEKHLWAGGWVKSDWFFTFRAPEAIGMSSEMPVISGRAFRWGDDVQRMHALIVDSWKARGPRNTFHIGDLHWRLRAHPGRDPISDIHLWEEGDRDLAGFAWFDPPESGDILSHPETDRSDLAQIHRRDDYAAAERAIGAREGDGPGTIWGRGGPVSVFSCRGETL